MAVIIVIITSKPRPQLAPDGGAAAAVAQMGAVERSSTTALRPIGHRIN